MARILKNKNLIRSRLATNYGGWMYCDTCGNNIGYICYVTYDELKFDYVCDCGNKGSIHINFEDSKDGIKNDAEMSLVKNRFCCPKDESPLITILDQKLKNYSLFIQCKACNYIYEKKK